MKNDFLALCYSAINNGLLLFRVRISLPSHVLDITPSPGGNKGIKPHLSTTLHSYPTGNTFITSLQESF